MAQFPMGRNTGRNFPVRGPGLDELLELLQNQGLTTQDENTKQRLESLRRADAGTSPLRARLYESLYKTGPVDIGEMTVDQERMPSSVDNSMRFGNTTYAEQGPPIIGGNVPTQRESASFAIPASVVNDMNRKPLLDPSLSRRTPAIQAERLQREADRKVVADNYESQGPPTFMQQGRDVDIIGGESSRSAGADEREPTGGQSVGLTDPRARTAKPATQTTDTATEPTTDADQQSILSRIGNALKDNPELTASGFQLLGGLISNAAQNRAQRRADRTTDQRVARANLISAITGGRARPTVERAQADTGGFMSLDTLGKALQGGGAAYKGELARQVEEAERERKAGLDERAASVAEQRAETQEQSRIDTDAYRDRLLTLQERGLRADYLKSLRSGQPKETPDKQTRNEYKAMSRILRQVDNVEDLLRDAGFFQAGSGLKVLEIAGLDEGLPQFMGGEKTRELKAAVNSLVQTLGEGLSGVLSDRDIEFLRQQAIKETDSLDTAMLKAQQIRNRLSQNIRENFEIDSQYFNMEPYRDLVDLVEASGEQGEGSFISDLSGASLNLD